MKNILVLGANGMAGHTITIYLKEQGFNVIGLTRKPVSFCQNIIADASDTNQILCIIIREKIDVVVNCIGILNKQAENNKAEAIFLNSYLPQFLAHKTTIYNFKFIHLSTDCVFAGNTGPYYENSFPDGITFYDRTKAMGEINDCNNLTFRNSIIGPDVNPNGIGLFNWFMHQEGKIEGYTKAIWTGVSTITLAKAIEIAIKENLSGLYNLVNNDSVNKYDLLLLFNKYFKNNALIIAKNDLYNLDKTLQCTRNDFNFQVPTYEQMIIEMRDWIINHKNIYYLNYNQFFNQ